MAGCNIQCVEIKDGWTDRQKWNYVRSLYIPSYKISDTGERLECYPWEDDAMCYSRLSDDPARIYDEAKYDQMYLTDHDAWVLHAQTKPFEKFLQWKYEYGTYHYGNLPQYKKNQHVGHKWAICPYSDQSSEGRTRLMLGLDELTALPQQNDHGIYYMKTTSNGKDWGFECTFVGCPYVSYYNIGVKYFYI